jgi:preprotein translocase subunit SecB
MDKSKQPGISFDGVFLSELKYELPKIPPKEFSYDVEFSSKHKIAKGKLNFFLTIRLYDGFELEITGIFSTIKGKGNLKLEEFADMQAPALLMPFAREIISNITSKAFVPHLLLPPTNIFALSKKPKKAKTTKTVEK